MDRRQGRGRRKAAGPLSAQRREQGALRGGAEPLSGRASAPLPAEFRCWSEEKIRVSDTDLNGHVNNAAIAAFCETGRAELMTAVAGPPDARPFGLAVARVLIEYRRELHYPGRIRIGTAMVGIGRSSLTLEQALFDEAEACFATSEAVFVLLDRSTRRPREVSAELRARFLERAPPRGGPVD